MASGSVLHPAAYLRLRPRVVPGSGLWYFQRDKVAVASLAMIVLIVGVALLAQWITPYADQGLGVPDATNALASPTLQHPLGTDELGRDILARIMFGARSSLTIGLIVVAVGVVVGTTLGAVAGFAGGWIDEIIMRFTDVVLSFPPLLLAIALAATLQPSIQTAVVAISATWWPWYTRLVRAEAVSVRERHYVLAARSIGASPLFILRRHILPNILGPVRVQAALDLGAAILAGTALSFLGLGPQAPTADWGVMVAHGRDFLVTGQWWLSIFPGLAIVIAVVAFNLFGDGFQAVMDPRSREVT
jgi:peptide/nickel transport system permease protein